MDINALRIAATVLSLLVFIGVCVWAYSRKNRQRFADAAELPFDDQ